MAGSGGLGPDIFFAQRLQSQVSWAGGRTQRPPPTTSCPLLAPVTQPSRRSRSPFFRAWLLVFIYGEELLNIEMGGPPPRQQQDVGVETGRVPTARGDITPWQERGHRHLMRNPAGISTPEQVLPRSPSPPSALLHPDTACPLLPPSNRANLCHQPPGNRYDTYRPGRPRNPSAAHSQKSPFSGSHIHPC